jgi:hypothetical protein
MTTRISAKARREVELVRALVAGMDDATLLALSKAALAQAAVFDVVAGSVPEQRDDADRLRKIAPVLHRAITARDYIENGEA